MNTDTPPQPAHGEPWEPYGDEFIDDHEGDQVCDAFGFISERMRDRAIQCVNLLSPHPDLSAVEVHSKETMDEVRAALGKSLPDWSELEAGKASGDFASSMTWGDVRRIKSALSKLNPPL